jgi:hypothetical protein
MKGRTKAIDGMKSRIPPLCGGIRDFVGLRLTRHLGTPVAVAVCCAILTACAGAPASAPSAAPSADQNAATVVATGEVAVRTVPTPAARIEGTIDTNPGVSGNSQCPAPAQPPAPAKPADFKAMAGGLLAYLNTGASLEAANQVMEVWGIRYSAPGSGEPLGGIEYGKILAGEDAQIIATFYDQSQTDTTSRPGDIVVFSCTNGQYQIAYQALNDPVFEGLVTNPGVLDVSDVSGDGIMDLSFVTGDCGASTCMEGVTILSAHNAAQLRNLSPDFPFVPFPTFEFLPGKQPPARDLVVAEGLLGDPSAGPQRSITSTWSFNGQIYTRTGEMREPAVYRIHMLHDGDDALRARDHRLADSLYGSVVAEPALQGWDASPFAANEGQVLGAFAYVRLMQSAALRDDDTGVGAAFDSLQRFALADSPGYLYTQMAELYLNEWKASKDAGKACAKMTEFARANQNATRWLGIEAFGAANYDYQPEDMCI